MKKYYLTPATLPDWSDYFSQVAVMDEVLRSDRKGWQRITKAFCVGQAKSGTASLYSLLARSYRAAYEPERAETLKMILRQSEGEIDTDSFDDYLRQRDRRLNLEYNIVWANQFIIDRLLTVFPLAAHQSGKFVIEALTPSDCQIQLLDNVAIVTVKVHLIGSYEGNDFDNNLRFTRIWNLSSSGTWQIVAAHSSVVM